MFKVHKMKIEDVEVVARMVALDHDVDPEKGYKEAKGHTLDHLEIVPQHCYVVENDNKQIVAVMVLHPQEKVFEIEDFHVKEIERNKEALALLKRKLLKYLENVQTEVLCCPFALKRLIATS
jgi:DNA-directed RNA polymerase alpha subunit